MPLIKSSKKAAVKKNIETEVHSGKKPIKQAIAIALTVQREARKKKRMAEGGMVGEPLDKKLNREKFHDDSNPGSDRPVDAKAEWAKKFKQGLDGTAPKTMVDPNMYAEGGDVKKKSVAEMIRMRKMAKGGKVLSTDEHEFVDEEQPYEVANDPMNYGNHIPEDMFDDDEKDEFVDKKGTAADRGSLAERIRRKMKSMKK